MKRFVKIPDKAAQMILSALNIEAFSQIHSLNISLSSQVDELNMADVNLSMFSPSPPIANYHDKDLYLLVVDKGFEPSDAAQIIKIFDIAASAKPLTFPENNNNAKAGGED